MTKSWARVAARVYTILIVPIASGFVAGALFVLSASPAALKHIADAAGTLSPFLTFLTVFVAAIGWYVTARLNGEEARHTERTKREHTRQGTLRRLRTLLRAVIAKIYECYDFRFLELDLYTRRLVFDYVLADHMASADSAFTDHINGIKQAHQRLTQRLSERETAGDLLDSEFDALDDLDVQLASTIEAAQRISTKFHIWTRKTMAEDEQTPGGLYVTREQIAQGHYDITRHDWEHRFRNVLPSIKAVLTLPSLGDKEMLCSFQQLEDTAQHIMEYPSLPPDD
jgi:hypothetical protein